VAVGTKNTGPAPHTKPFFASEGEKKALMVASPHFQHDKLPDFGKENLWFL
jgi:hypothetical protein